jgi:hypothetical protein
MFRSAAKVLGLVFLSSLTQAMPVQVRQEWVHIYDASPAGHDQASAVAVTPSGSVYAAGMTGAHEVLTLKYGPSGNLAWARTFTYGHYIDAGYDVVIDPSDESVFVVGRADMPTFSTGGLVMKYDASGTLLWTSVYHAPSFGSSEFFHAQMTPSGGLVAGGSLGQGGLVAVGFDPQGNILWSNSAPGGDYATGLTIDAAGDILLSGIFDEQGINSHFGVAKFSSAGALLWLRTLSGGGLGRELATAVATDPSGAVYATGRLFDPTSGPNEALVKLDPSGIVLWTRTHHGTQPNPQYYDESFDAVTFAANGNIRVAGETANATSGTDVQVFEYTPLGQLVWQSTWNGPGNDDDSVVDIATGADGSLTVLANTEESSGSYDPVVIRWDDQGALRWADVDAFSGAGRAYLAYGAFGPNGVSAFVGLTPADFSVPSNALVLEERDQSVPFCFGDGSSVHCPCSNDAVPGQGRGCLNSLGDAARLTDAGEASLSGDTVVLSSSGETPSAPSMFLQGSTQTSPASFGDGLLCVGGILKRLYVRTASAGVVSAPHGGDLSISARSAALGDAIAVGSTRFYQVYYRDTSASFCPPPTGSGWNVSSAIAILWVQ